MRRASAEDSTGAFQVFLDAVKATAVATRSQEARDKWCTLLSEPELRRRFELMDCWVAERDSQVVGFCVLDPETDELKSMYVSPTNQGIGAGRALLHACEERARSLGLQSLWLTATPDGVGFYAGLGWTESGQPELIDDALEVRTMVKSL